MSNRGTILLAIGMLVLGLVLGGVGGGAAGYFVGRNTGRAAFGQFNLPPSTNSPNLPGNPPLNPRGNLPGGRSFQGGANGARVIQVEADSAAAKAGLQVGDVITAVGGTTVDDTHSLADLVKAHKPGDRLDFSVTRGNQNLTLTVELTASPSDSTAAYLGIRYAPAAPQSQDGGRRFQ